MPSNACPSFAGLTCQEPSLLSDKTLSWYVQLVALFADGEIADSGFGEQIIDVGDLFR